MKKPLTVHQASLLLALCILGTKFQRFPALLVESFGRNCWIMYAVLTTIEILVGLIFINLMAKSPDKTIFQLFSEYFGVVGKTIFSVLICLFFIAKAVIAYKGTHEFFANVLFDKLPWKYFSVLLVILLVVMVLSGLNGLGRSAELYIFVIGFGVIACLGLGIVNVKFSAIFPILDCNVGDFALSALKFQPWLGDYMVILFFIGNVKFQSSPKTRMVVTYIVLGIVNTISILFFYCVNEYLSVFQANGLASITQYSLIGLGIGRPDWFLVLFVFISKLIACGFYVYAYTVSFGEIINLKDNKIVNFSCVLALYFIEYFVFKNVDEAITSFKGVLGYCMIGVCVLMTILVIILTLLNKRGRLQNQPNTFYKARCEI